MSCLRKSSNSLRSAGARREALELESAMTALSRFDEGVDLVLYFKYLSP